MTMHTNNVEATIDSILGLEDFDMSKSVFKPVVTGSSVVTFKYYNAVDELGYVYYSEYDDKLARAKRKMFDQGYLGAEFTPLEDYVKLYGATTVRMWYELGVTRAQYDADDEIPF